MPHGDIYTTTVILAKAGRLRDGTSIQTDGAMGNRVRIPLATVRFVRYANIPYGR